MVVGVLIWGKLYYTKKEGYQTPLLSALYAIFNHLNDGKVTGLAPEGTFLKLFDSLYKELKQKEDVINSFVAKLKYSAKFDERIKERFFGEEIPLENHLIHC